MSEVVRLNSIQTGALPTSKGTMAEGTILSYTNSQNQIKELKIFHYFKQNLANEIHALGLQQNDVIKLTFTKNAAGYNEIAKVEKVDSSTPLGSDKPAWKGGGGFQAKAYDTTGPKVGNAITNAVSLVIHGKRNDVKQAAMELLDLSIELEKFMKAKDDAKPITPIPNKTNQTIEATYTLKPAVITQTTEIDVDEFTKI